ncbi:1,4-dihydroxy-2-naphthoate polyprenyltransferase [Chondromyces apiculatus]|uniref:1,4-dihydroxy-2-naphthoate octaprenyltransferase n=1 Tax=Chondromyces apiculatus DSM 436 TaxID=1192034 RepID=A0A017TE75_9BACT|nr:1,4-dihydroxy-2-naphthoate polyprenyltransferase [Chondromyces apiculatus]EYF07573.1 1,4-dihydroxy-2-naphthoate octaprenyltransferase [Chondromyces apiculatus DSM 436]
MSEVAVPGIAPGSFKAWVLACRPATLPVAVAPVVVGTAVAYALGGMRLGPALAALFGALLFQVISNFANDVFDHEKGADTHERLGPTRATQSGLLSGRQVRMGMLVAVALSLPFGLYLVSVGGLAIVAIGVASILAAVAYTGGPYPLGYHGLGDVFVFLFFGLVAVCGTVFVQLGGVPPLAWLAALPVGAIATAVLVVNNVRDRETDVRAGKRTLAVRLGRKGGVAEYVLLLLVAYAVPVALAAGPVRSWALGAHAAGGMPWVLLPIVTLPVALRCVKTLRTAEGRPLNACLAATAKLLLMFSVLFAAGIALSAA